MRTIIKFYGNTTEITKIEKTPQGIRIPYRKEKRLMYTARRFDNLRRTKNTCVRRVSAAIAEYGSPLFVTFTFSGTASDVKFASDSLSIFQRRLRGLYPMAQSIFIPEISPCVIGKGGGRLHFHGLLFNVPAELGDIRKGRRIVSYGLERKQRTLAKLWREGFVDALQTDGSYRLAGYISKYVLKAGGDILLAPVRLLRVSNGFPKEIVVRDEYLASRIENKLKNTIPVSHWEHQSPFLGKISKTKYEKT